MVFLKELKHSAKSDSLQVTIKTLLSEIFGSHFEIEVTKTFNNYK